MNTVVSMASDGTLTSLSGAKLISAVLEHREASDDAQTETVSGDTVTATGNGQQNHAVFKSTSAASDNGASNNGSDWTLYMHYIQSTGWWRFAILVVGHGFLAVFDNFPTVWLKQWSEAEETHPHTRTAYYLAVYGAISLAGLTTVISVLAYDCLLRYTKMMSNTWQIHVLESHSIFWTSAAYETIGYGNQCQTRIPRHGRCWHNTKQILPRYTTHQPRNGSQCRFEASPLHNQFVQCLIEPENRNQTNTHISSITNPSH